MSSSPAIEAKLNRMADDLASVVQALRLMSATQRQHGEQLAQVIALLTPEQVEPGPSLAELLGQLIGRVGEIGGELRQVGGVLDETTRRLPERMAAALDGALSRAEKRAAADAVSAKPVATAPRR